MGENVRVGRTAQLEHAKWVLLGGSQAETVSALVVGWSHGDIEARSSLLSGIGGCTGPTSLSLLFLNVGQTTVPLWSRRCGISRSNPMV